MLHVISTQCVARDLHTIVPKPLERTCWRQFAAHRRDCIEISNCAFGWDYFYGFDMARLDLNCKTPTLDWFAAQ